MQIQPAARPLIPANSVLTLYRPQVQNLGLAVRMAGAGVKDLVQPVVPLIQGRGPLSDEMMMDILDTQAREWGIPKALYPQIHWASEMSGDGETMNTTNLIRLNPQAYVFPGRTLQHELVHAFSDVHLAAIPTHELPAIVQGAFHQAIVQGLFFGVPIVDVEANQRKGALVFPELSPLAQKLFAGFVSDVIQAREKNHQGLRREFTPLQLSDAERERLHVILPSLDESTPEKAEKNEKLLNAIVSFYSQFMNQLLLPQLKFEQLRQALKQHPLQPTATPIDKNRLIQDKLLGMEKTVTVHHEYDCMFYPSPKALAAYYYSSEEVQAKIQEENLFERLTGQIQTLKASGAIEIPPQIQAVLDAESAVLQHRNKALISGEAEIRQMGRQANFKSLAAQSEALGKQELGCQRDSLLRFYLSSPERQSSTLTDLGSAIERMKKRISGSDPSQKETELRETRLAELKGYESRYATYTLLNKVKALIPKEIGKPAFSAFA